MRMHYERVMAAVLGVGERSKTYLPDPVC